MAKRLCIVCGKKVSENDGPRVCDECWKCPECGVGVEGEDGDTGLVLDEDDCVVCYACDASWDNKHFEGALLKKHDRTTCPTCKGSGTVPKKK